MFTNGLQVIAALHDKRAAISFVSRAPQHALYADNFACIEDEFLGPPLTETMGASMFKIAESG